jgi:hypothetical protein
VPLPPSRVGHWSVMLVSMENFLFSQNVGKVGSFIDLFCQFFFSQHQKSVDNVDMCKN